MQIHELDTYIGTPSDSDFLAVDDGTETFKIPLPSVGVSTEMTLEEATTGAETAPRVIAPSVLNSYVSSEVGAVICLVVTISDFSALPQVAFNENITDDMVVVNSVLTNPSAQTGDWTATTAEGSVTITGAISGTTSLTLYLIKSR